MIKPLTKKEIERGKKILTGEYLKDINENTVFDAIVYTILSQRELYKTQVKHYHMIREAKMMNPESMLNSPSSLWKHIRGMSLASDKLNRILQTSEYYYDNGRGQPYYMLSTSMNKSRNGQIDVRETFVKGAFGINNKSASMILMKMGCTKMAILDTWVLQWLQYPYLTATSNKEYVRLEEIIGNYARGNHCTMADYSAGVWGKYSSYNESVNINPTHYQSKLDVGL